MGYKSGIANKGRLVSQYINTAYDTVKVVADNIDNIKLVADCINDIGCGSSYTKEESDTLFPTFTYLAANYATQEYVDGLVLSGTGFWSQTGSNIYYTTGKVGVGIINAEGLMHIQDGDSLTTPNTAADTLIVESLLEGGINVLTPDAVTSNIFFGSPSANRGALISWTFNSGLMKIGPADGFASGALALISGPGAEGLRVDAGQNVFIQNGVLKVKERSAASASTSLYGQIWVKNVSPNQLWFTDNAGNDIQLGVGGGGGSSLWTAEITGISYSGKIKVGASGIPTSSIEIEEATDPARITFKDQYDIGVGSKIEHNNKLLAIYANEALGNIEIGTNSAAAIFINDKQHIGFGAATNTNVSSVNWVNFGYNTYLSSNKTPSGFGWTDLTQNSYYNGTGSIYISDGKATMFEMYNGTFWFGVAPTGTAGAACTYLSAFYILNDGRVSGLAIKTDPTLADNSTQHLVSQSAVKAYVDNLHTPWAAETIGISYTDLVRIGSAGISSYSALLHLEHGTFNARINFKDQYSLVSGAWIDYGSASLTIGSDEANYSILLGNSLSVKGITNGSWTGVGLTNISDAWANAHILQIGGMTYSSLGTISNGLYNDATNWRDSGTSNGMLLDFDIATGLTIKNSNTGVADTISVFEEALVVDIKNKVKVGKSTWMPWGQDDGEALQVGAYGCVFNDSTDTYFGDNIHNSLGWKHGKTGPVSAIQLTNGTIQLRTGVTNTINQFVVWTDSLKIANNGEVFLETGVLKIKEQVAANAATGSYGQIWVKTVSPNQLWFTDDTGTSIQLGVGGGGANLISALGTPTYTTFQDNLNIIQSAGLITGFIITDATLGAVDVAAGTGFIRATDSAVAELLSLDVAATGGVTLVDGSINYLYVEYNAGTPQVVATTTKRSDANTNIFLGNVYRDGTSVHINGYRSQKIGDSTCKVITRLLDTHPMDHVSGASLSELGTRNIAITLGTFWEGLNKFTTSAFDSSVADTFRYFYDDGASGWTEVTAQSQISNTQYDDGTGTLATVSPAKYGVHWVYIGTDSDIYVVYGTGDYALVEAQAAQPGAVPPHIESHGRLIGKIVIQRDAAVFYSIESAFVESFAVTGVNDHTNLTSIGLYTHTQIDAHIDDSTIHGYQPLVINTQAGNYTLALTDAAKYVRMTSGTANNLTVPLNASVAFAIGTEIEIAQAGAGATTIVATGGVTINTSGSLAVAAQYDVIKLVKTATDTWNAINISIVGAAGGAGDIGKGAHAILSGNLNLTIGSAVNVPWAGTDVYDDLAFHNPASNSSRMTIPSGVTRVEINASIEFSSVVTTGNYRRAILRKNGVDITASLLEMRPPTSAVNPVDYRLLMSYALNVVATDYIEVRITSDGTSDSMQAAHSFYQIKVLQ